MEILMREKKLFLETEIKVSIKSRNMINSRIISLKNRIQYIEPYSGWGWQFSSVTSPQLGISAQSLYLNY